MRKNCIVCTKLYSTAYRGWYDYLIPRVCSSHCFVRWIDEAHAPLKVDMRCGRISLFKHSLHGFRSEYESRFHKYLINAEFKHLYESLVFTLADKSRYVPDFFLSDRVFVEVKGLWSPEGKRKILAFIDQFPDYPIVVADLALIRMLSSKRG